MSRKTKSEVLICHSTGWRRLVQRSRTKFERLRLEDGGLSNLLSATLAAAAMIGAIAAVQVEHVGRQDDGGEGQHAPASLPVALQHEKDEQTRQTPDDAYRNRC